MKSKITPVFPSKQITVFAEDIESEYSGAHCYSFVNCAGFADGQAKYTQTVQRLTFVKADKDGSITPGLQSEQLVIALIDRTTKLNAKYPSDQNKKMIEGLNMFLDACKERVEERINRGVMGQLKK